MFSLACSELAVLHYAGSCKLQFFLILVFGKMRYEKLILWLLHKYERQILHVGFGLATCLVVHRQHQVVGVQLCKDRCSRCVNTRKIILS